MPYAAKIILDSVQPDGVRLTTMEVTLPKFILAELNTHRAFSRNSASSRAIPFEKMLQRVMDDPVMPVWWGKNQSGMQAREEMHQFNREQSTALWLKARDEAVATAYAMNSQGCHKQIVNRLIEPWLFTTVIVSSTNYAHFFALRCHPDAQPEMRHTADLMKAAYDESTPRRLEYGHWHMPYIRDQDHADAVEMTPDPTDNPHEKFVADYTAILAKVSTARCARVSYLTHDGKRDLQADINLHHRLIESGHWSPTEHIAQACMPGVPNDPKAGNFDPGWIQYRKTYCLEFAEEQPWTM